MNGDKRPARICQGILPGIVPGDDRIPRVQGIPASPVPVIAHFGAIEIRVITGYPLFYPARRRVEDEVPGEIVQEIRCEGDNPYSFIGTGERHGPRLLLEVAPAPEIERADGGYLVGIAPLHLGRVAEVRRVRRFRDVPRRGVIEAEIVI